MKERQRWRSDEDAILRAYVRQYGPRDWHLVSHRMSVALGRDAKSCLERWKNYLKPGIKKGSLTEEEQRLVIRLQAKHGNKWKRIAAEVPGRTAKRLGKWWEVFKEKQQREEVKESSSSINCVVKYHHILENFAEKLVKQRQIVSASMLPAWLSPAANASSGSSSPSVALTLSPAAAAPACWGHVGANDGSFLPAELAGCCRELQEGQRAWAEHRKEAAWRVKRVELQLEAEKAGKRREKVEEIEARIRALKEDERAALERIEAEYREQMAALRRDAEVKEQKLAEQWAAKHARLRKVVEQFGCHQWILGGAAAAAAAEASRR